MYQGWSDLWEAKAVINARTLISLCFLEHGFIADFLSFFKMISFLGRKVDKFTAFEKFLVGVDKDCHFLKDWRKSGVIELFREF